jgi:hypothetical protein
MAEKLSKVARDKFYPIREEEIERMNGTPPVIHVSFSLLTTNYFLTNYIWHELHMA